MANFRSNSRALQEPPDEPFVRRLSRFLPLSPDEADLLGRRGAAAEEYPADIDIVGEGETRRSLFVLAEGMACRYRTMEDGRRQIISFLLPGDFCDMQIALLGSTDHSISSLTRVKVNAISRERLIGVMFKHPRIAAVLWWGALQEQAMLRERIVALGRRNARGRVAYLLCELWWRHEAVGLTRGEMLPLPLTQLELADALGLTPAHVNRVLMGFRDSGLISLSHRVLTVRNLAGLQEIGECDNAYLRLDPASPETAAMIDRSSHAASPEPAATRFNGAGD